MYFRCTTLSPTTFAAGMTDGDHLQLLLTNQYYIISTFHLHQVSAIDIYGCPDNLKKNFDGQKKLWHNFIINVLIFVLKYILKQIINDYKRYCYFQIYHKCSIYIRTYPSAHSTLIFPRHLFEWSSVNYDLNTIYIYIPNICVGLFSRPPGTVD